MVLISNFYFSLDAVQLAVMAFIAMTLFLRTEMHRDSTTDGGIYAGALFFTLVMIMFNGMAEVSMTIAKLPVFYKQRDLLFYPSWSYAIPTWILKIPIALVEVALWTFLTYYVIGFDPNVGRYKEAAFPLSVWKVQSEFSFCLCYVFRAGCSSNTLSYY